MSEIEKMVIRCIRGHETVVTAETLKPMLDVNKKGTTFVKRYVEDGVVCGAPCTITQRNVAGCSGYRPGAKQMMKTCMHRRWGRNSTVAASGARRARVDDVSQNKRGRGVEDATCVLDLPYGMRHHTSHGHPTRPPISDASMTDPSTAIRNERPKPSGSSRSGGREEDPRSLKKSHQRGRVERRWPTPCTESQTSWMTGGH